MTSVLIRAVRLGFPNRVDRVPERLHRRELIEQPQRLDFVERRSDLQIQGGAGWNGRHSRRSGQEQKGTRNRREDGQDDEGKNQNDAAACRHVNL